MQRMSALSLAFLLTACQGGSMTPAATSSGVTPNQRSYWQAAHSRYRVLHSFAGGSDGAQPFFAGLISARRALYGTTEYGGTSSFGTVFRVSRDGRERVLYSFAGGRDGAEPHAGLIDVNGMLYGTTSSGGRFESGCFSGDSCGTIFQISRTGAETVLHRFSGGAHGYAPLTGLTDVQGVLYGTTAYGGSSNHGTVFRISTTGADFRTLYSFAGGSDGALPEGDLIDLNGTLYGTTAEGGGSGCASGNGCGTVFRINTTGTERVLHSFDGASGEYPDAGVIDVNGMLYGTTGGGDAAGCLGSGCGTVFRVNTSGARFKVLYKFSGGADGGVPNAALIAVNGVLYGTTYVGGSADSGIAFSVTTTGTQNVLHTFGGAGDGVNPTARLLDVHGKLYGTTVLGGSSSLGTIFALNP